MASMVKNMIKFSTVAGLALGSGFYVHSERKKNFFMNVQAATENTLRPGSPVDTADIVNRIGKFGIPTFGEPLVKQSFIILYNNEKRIPSCVVEHLSKKNIIGSACGFNKIFHEDQKDIDEYFRTTNSDYSKLCYFSKRRRYAPYLMSNVGPMDPELNHQKWAELEKTVQKLTEEYANVYVYTGSLFLPTDKYGKRIVEYEVIGKNGVAVPTHFYKCILAETEDKELDILTYVLENCSTEKDLDTFFCDRSFVEKAAGYRIGRGLSDETFRKINGKDNPHYNNLKDMTNLRLKQ